MKKTWEFIRDNFIIFFSYAVFGWIYEFLYYLIDDKVIVNRGFLHGPYLPVYGFGALLLWYMLRNFIHKKRKVFGINMTPVYSFLIIFVVTTLVEYVSHFVLDKYFGIVLWDYTQDFLNINGRVCFRASRNFAIGGTALLYFIQPFIDKIINIKNSKPKDIITFILLMIVIIDFFITILH